MTRIRQWTDPASVWTSVNPILMKGEVGWEEDTNKAKRGDGVSPWNTLPYAINPGAPLESPTFSGNPTAPTPATEDNDASIATTEFVKNQNYAPLVSPSFSGNVTAPTPLPGDNDTSVATTAFVQTAIAPKAPTASPTFTGDPKAPTPATSDSDTSIATTAFVKAALLAAHPVGDIKMTTVNTNPGTYLGGTWVAWGSGRVPVGIDAAQTEFDTAEETGGAKTHTLTAGQLPNITGAFGATVPDNHSAFAQGAFYGATISPSAPEAKVPPTTGGPVYGYGFNFGANQPHNNLQPYIVCYMWKRTA